MRKARNAFLIDSLRQIRATMHRFLSILVITMLGVAFFAGLRATGPDMRSTATAQLNELRFMDIRLLSTVGFNSDDMLAIEGVPGIEAVSPAYSYDAYVETPDNNLTVCLHAISRSSDAPQALNLPLVLEGRMPAASGECLADPLFLQLSGYALGDTVQIRSGTSSPVADALHTDSFTIVGVAQTPLYISYERAPSSIGNGQSDAYLLILPEDFAYEVYTEVYLTVANTAAHSRFDDEYTELLQPVMDDLEDIGTLRSHLRYEQIITEARDEITSARTEVADGYRQLDDARQELTTARLDLDTAWQQYHDGLDELDAEIRTAKRKLADGQADLQHGQQQYDQSLAAFHTQMAGAQDELAQGYRQHELAYAQYQAAQSAYQEQLQHLTAWQSELDQAAAAHADHMAAYTLYTDLHGQLQTAMDAGNTPDALATINAIAAQIEPDQPELAAALHAYTAQPESSDAAATARTAIRQLGDALQTQKQQLDAAQDQLAANQAQVEAGTRQLAEAAELLSANKQALDEAGDQLDQSAAQLHTHRLQGEQALAGAQQQLEESAVQLAAAQKTLTRQERAAQRELADALQQLQEGEADYADGEVEFLKEQADAIEELRDAQQQIEDAEQQLNDLAEPSWYVLNHDTNIGFIGYKQDANRIEALSKVVPLLFFLVAILVTMTSMTRLVDSDRAYIGTYKALGYGDAKIALRYLLYAVSASGIGGVIGVFVGLNVFPRVVYGAYSTLYRFPAIHILYRPNLMVFSVVLAVACAALPAWLVCMRSLRAMPAELMRPAAPQIGKRTLLERITFLWRRLSFSQKVSIRNLFRYKKRFFMTVIGVAGCTALMFTGFGLRDSVTTIVSKQFQRIHQYDVTVDFKQDLPAKDHAAVHNILKGDRAVVSYTQLAQQSVDAITQAGTKSVFLIVPDQPGQLPAYIHLQNRISAEHLPLSQDAVLITEKLADILAVQPGDAITIRNSQAQEATVRIGGIAENYVQHYIYMAPALYQASFGEPPKPNQMLCILGEDALPDQRDALSAQLLDNAAVSSVIFSANSQASMQKMVGVLNYVVLILIVSAAALVFVVLFSLTSINLEERNRELATIKVLGFYNWELAAYIYRENVALTIIGTGAGLLLGVALQRYVIATMEVDILMFSRDLLWQSYVYAAGLTVLFASMVNGIMYRFFVKIDMVSSLKSIE